MTDANPKVRVGIGVFVCKDGKFLMRQRQGAHGAGLWPVPGGRLVREEKGNHDANCPMEHKNARKS